MAPKVQTTSTAKTRKLLKFAKETGESLVKQAGGELCNYACVFSDAETVTYMLNQGCYGSIANVVYKTGSKYSINPVVYKITNELYPVFLVDWHDEAAMGSVVPERRKAIDAWTKYVVTQSPYSHVFVSKQWQKFRTTAHILRMSVTPQEVVGAAQMMRVRREQPTLCERFYKFKDYMHPDLAMFLATHSQAVGNASKQGFTLGYPISHFPFDGTLSRTGLINLFAHKVQDNGSKTMRDGDFGYGSSMSIWDKRIKTSRSINEKDPIIYPNGVTPLVMFNGWNDNIKKSMVHLWEDAAKVALEFCKLNKLDEVYAVPIK